MLNSYQLKKSLVKSNYSERDLTLFNDDLTLFNDDTLANDIEKAESERFEFNAIQDDNNSDMMSQYSVSIEELL
jgi:hypothetical protein